MLPSFFGLNTVTRALMTQQEAIDVVNQNISNASTPGYSRQSAVITATDPYTAPAFDHPTFSGQIGTGAQVTKIDRFQDELLNSQIRVGSQSVGQLQVLDDLYTQIQAIYNDPSNVAINSAATDFFNAVHDMSNDPESMAARQSLQEQGQNLASAISSRYQALTQVQSDMNTKVQSIVSDINSTISQIANLNLQITQVKGIGDNANDLMDQRDVLVDHLSTLIDTRVVQNLDGTDTIQMNGRFLVNKDQAYTLQTLTNAASPAFIKPVEVFWTDDVNRFEITHPGYDPITGVNITTGEKLPSTATPPLSVSQAMVTTGSLAGAMQIRDQVIQGTLLPQLNELADALTNTQVLSTTTGLTASQTVSGQESFTLTVMPNAALGGVNAGQPVKFTVQVAAGSTIQNVIDTINGAST